jgi:hypothetical protein
LHFFACSGDIDHLTGTFGHWRRPSEIQWKMMQEKLDFKSLDVPIIPTSRFEK